MAFQTFTIGRSADADISIDHDSVSRQHAEVTLVSSGHYYLVDRASSWGSFVFRNNEWQELKQGYVNADEYVAFGKYREVLSKLLTDIRLVSHASYDQEPLSVRPRRSATTGQVEV